MDLKARTLVTAIIVTVFLAQLVSVEANPYHFITSPVIELTSPCSHNYGISSPQRPFQYNTNHFNFHLVILPHTTTPQ
jgi:hypothetical protein